MDPASEDTNNDPLCIVPFQFTWKIPSYDSVYNHSRPGMYVLSQTIPVKDKGVLSLILYPRGRNEDGDEQEFSELYVRLNETKGVIYPYVCYYYGFLNNSNNLRERIFVDRTRIDCDDICVTPGSKWMPSETPFLDEDHLQKDNSLVLFIKGTFSYDTDGFPLQISPSNICPIAKDELLLIPSLVNKAKISKSSKKVNLDDDQHYLKELRMYEKWSKLIVEDDSLLLTAAEKYNVREIIQNKGFTLITPNNVIDVLLSSDIYRDEGVKEKCIKFIELQGPMFFETYAWKELRSYVPQLQVEVMQSQQTKHVRKSRLINIEGEENRSLEDIRDADWNRFMKGIILLGAVIICAGIYAFFVKVDKDEDSDVKKDSIVNDL